MTEIINTVYGWIHLWTDLSIGMKILTGLAAYYFIKLNIQSFVFGVRSAFQVEDALYREERQKRGLSTSTYCD